MDLDAYFARIGFDGERAPTLATLRSLHALHPAAIPFENLDVLLGVPISLELDALCDKLLTRRRGGYCFEQNLLLAAVLRALGYEVTGLVARVRYQARAAVTARTHCVLHVLCEGEAYFVDVGFGGLVLTAPLLEDLRSPQATTHEPYRVVKEQDQFTIEAQVRGTWQTLYRFDAQRQEQIDYELSNHWTSTHPSSRFKGALMVARTVPGRRYALVDNEFATHVLGEESERRKLHDARELEDVLRETFCIRLPQHPDLPALLARTAAL